MLERNLISLPSLTVTQVCQEEGGRLAVPAVTVATGGGGDGVAQSTRRRRRCPPTAAPDSAAAPPCRRQRRLPAALCRQQWRRRRRVRPRPPRARSQRIGHLRLRRGQQLGQVAHLVDGGRVRTQVPPPRRVPPPPAGSSASARPGAAPTVSAGRLVVAWPVAARSAWIRPPAAPRLAWAPLLACGLRRRGGAGARRLGWASPMSRAAPSRGVTSLPVGPQRP